jgi:phospholipid N-methyltransferase
MKSSSVDCPRRTPFENLIEKLKCPDGCKVLDVGAGGFCGETTTQYLVKHVTGEITAIEIEKDKALALKERFQSQSQVNVINGDFLKYRFDDIFDLIILDLDTKLIPEMFEVWINGKVFDLLSNNGIVIAINVGSYANCCDKEKGLQEHLHKLIYEFMQRYWGTLLVTDNVIINKFNTDSRYRVIEVVDKWYKDPKNFIQWIVLKKWIR